MLFRIIALFVALPIIELWLLLLIADHTSWPFTIMLVLVTGIVGGMLARQQGLQTWQSVHQRLAAGQIPSREMIDGLMILVAGALLITPGVITDVVGFSLLTPWFRAMMRRYLGKRFQVHTSFTSTAGPMDDQFRQPGSQPPSSEENDDDIIDVEFRRQD